MIQPAQLDDHRLAMRMQIVAAKERSAARRRDGAPPNCADPNRLAADRDIIVFGAITRPMTTKGLSGLLSLPPEAVRKAINRLLARKQIRVSSTGARGNRAFVRVESAQ